MRAGKVAGVQLVLNNWFLALMLLFALAGLALKVAGVFAAVLWHECAHALVARLLGYKVREMELLPFGGVARIERIGDAGPVNELLMASAGPAASLLLAAAVYCGMAYYPGWTEGRFYFTVNLTLAFFNLLPGLPLDGGRMLRAVLALRLDYGKATLLVVKVGKLLAIGLAGWAGLDFWQTGTVNVTFLLASVFLYAAARAETQVAGFRTMRVLAHKKADLTKQGAMVTVHYTALARTRAKDLIGLFGPEQYHMVLVIDDQFRLQGMLTETQVWEGLPERGLYARIGEFL